MLGTTYSITNVAHVAVEYNGLIALAQRADHVEYPGLLEILGGEVQDGEQPLYTAYREAEKSFGEDLEFLNEHPITLDPIETPHPRNVLKKTRVHCFAAVALS